MGRHTRRMTRATCDCVSTSLSRRPTRAFIGIKAHDIPVLLLSLGMLCIGLVGNIITFTYVIGGLRG